MPLTNGVKRYYVFVKLRSLWGGVGLALGLEEGVGGVRVVQLVQDFGLLPGYRYVAVVGAYRREYLLKKMLSSKNLGLFPAVGM